ERRAVFWCGLLRPLIFGEIAPGAASAYLRKLASEAIVFPDGKSRKPSLSTLKRKLRQYRHSGFVALARKRRRDAKSVRASGTEVIRTAVDAKRDVPTRSAHTLNLILEHLHGKRVPRSTLYRHLKAAGATRLKLGVVKEPVRKRWSAEHTHDLWVGDFADGPCVMRDGLAMRTHLSAFIDAHSRYVVAGRYYLRETLDVLCDTLLRAVAPHGTPLALYLDNAKVYHAHSLRVFCARMEIRLLHRPVGDPSPGGVIERFIQTAQDQFENEVRAGPILTLERLNEAFSAWLEVSYHQCKHSETGQKPADRHQGGSVGLRVIDMQAAAESFLQREGRTVDRTFSDVRLHGRFYRVDPRLRGDRVEVGYDPFGALDKVWIFSKDGEYLGEGTRHGREEGFRPEPASAPPSRVNLLNILIEKQKRLRAGEQGIEFGGALRRGPWPFPAFAACMAGLLSRRGGLSAFNAEELSALRQFHDRQPRLTRTLLKKAFLKAGQKSIPAILYALQNLQEDQ
nr:DDE-type integrase/transposase/recombinase [Desulfobacterales bacterium]